MELSRNRFLQLAGSAIGSLGISTSSRREVPDVVGNWKLVSLVTKDVATGKIESPLGEHPKGYLIYTPEGRMMALLVHETRSPPTIDRDRINLHEFMAAYSGRYTVEGAKVVHHVDISWNESWTGTDQIRFLELQGDKLTINAPISPSTDWRRRAYWSGNESIEPPRIPSRGTWRRMTE